MTKQATSSPVAEFAGPLTLRPSSISVANFKSFGEHSQTIPLKPITLVFGPNSAGKSSLLHSLLWLNHAETTGNTDVHHPVLADKTVNLGGFDACLNRNTKKKLLEFSLTLKNPAPNRDSQHWHETISEFTFSFLCGRQAKNKKPSFHEWTIVADGKKLLSAKLAKSSSDVVKKFDFHFDRGHPALNKFSESLTHDEKRDLSAQFRYIQGMSINFLPSNLALSISPEDSVAEKQRQFEYKKFREECQKFLDGDRSSAEELSIWAEKFGKLAIPWNHQPEITEPLFRAFEAIFSSIRGAATEMVYIPPLRAIPDRSMDLRGCEQSGWRLLAQNPDICKQINRSMQSLGMEYELHVRTLIPVETAKSTIYQTVAMAEVAAMEEAGVDRGRLSNAIEAARVRFENLHREGHEKWISQHPDFLNYLIQEAKQWFIDNPEETLSRYLEYLQDRYQIDPDHVEKEVPEWWYQADAEAEAESYWEAWQGEKNGGYYMDEAIRIYVSEDPTVREIIDSAFPNQLIEDSLSPVDGHLQLRLRDTKRNVWVSLQDVGVGISQSLPILIESLAQQNQLMLIEQPELHIHPRLQAAIGDVFIQSALGDNQNRFLLETHSEHLILRILRRIRETTEGDFSDWPEELKNACPNGIRPEDVAVIYIEPSEDGARITEIPITADGDFSRNWPNGFFTERSKELF